MFGTIRRHQGTIWIIVAVVTIGSFVVLGPTNAKMGNILGFFSNKSQYGVLGGQPISIEARESAMREVMLDYFLNRQEWLSSSSPDLLRETYWRLMIIQKQKELGVHVSADAAADYARRFIPPNPGAMDQFAETILKPHGLDLTDFDNYLRHQVGLRQLIRVAGVSGQLVTPQEAETEYRLESRDVESSIVFFSASNYLSSVTVTPAAVMQFYSNQLANYRVPDQVQVQYVKFVATNYTAKALAAVTNLEQIVDENVQHMGTNLFHGTTNAVESRTAIKQDIMRQITLVQTRRAAGDFATSVDQAQPHTLASFAKLAATNGLTVMTAAPFGREYGPEDLKVPPEFAQKAFTLTPEDMFAGPIVAEDGVYVIALVERQPARTPSFKEIEGKVTTDFRYGNAFQLAQQTAVKFSGTVSNGLAAGKSFASLCAQAGLRSQSLPLLSRETQSLPENIESRVDMSLLREVVFSTLPGKASRPASAHDGAFMVYVERQLPVDEAKLKTRMPEYLARMREARQADAFNQWFNSQLRQDPEFLQYVNNMMNDAQKSSGARRPKS